jgi:hypothetical protein
MSVHRGEADVAARLRSANARLQRDEADLGADRTGEPGPRQQARRAVVRIVQQADAGIGDRHRTADIAPALSKWGPVQTRPPRPLNNRPEISPTVSPSNSGRLCVFAAGDFFLEFFSFSRPNASRYCQAGPGPIVPRVIDHRSQYVPAGPPPCALAALAIMALPWPAGAAERASGLAVAATARTWPMLTRRREPARLTSPRLDGAAQHGFASAR